MAVNDSSRTLAGPTPPPRLLFAGWTTLGGGRLSRDTIPMDPHTFEIKSQ